VLEGRSERNGATESTGGFLSLRVFNTKRGEMEQSSYHGTRTVKTLSPIRTDSNIQKATMGQLTESGVAS